MKLFFFFFYKTALQSNPVYTHVNFVAIFTGKGIRMVHYIRILNCVFTRAVMFSCFKDIVRSNSLQKQH